MMLRFRRSLLSAVAVVLILSSTLAFSCGVERQSVKVGTDADIGKVNFNAPQTTTIANLRAFPTPGTIPANNRISPEETTVWVVDATLTLIKLESDQDYHLVIQDAAGLTMIAEIPAPSCVPSSSPMNPGVTSSRAKVDAMFNVTTSFTSVNVPVRITGVGMHDFPHGQTGAAPNQIELHSVIDIIFNPGNATPDFSLSASPTSLSVTQGQSGSTTISTSVTGGFNSAISLSASGLPAGVTASFSPASIGAPGNGSSTLTFSASSTATTGTTNVTVTASGGGVTHTTTVALTVNAAANPDFTVSASPTSLSVTQGSSGSTTISTTVSGGFNSAISLSASGLPAGVTASFNPTSIGAPGSGSSTLTFSASSTATTGTTNVTVTASGGGVTHTTTVALTVNAAANPSFTLSASPTSLSVAQGGSGSSTISTTVSGGFNSAISLSASGLPAGVTASFNPASIGAPGSGSSTLTFSANATATTGTTNVTVNASGGGITHTVTIALTITATATPSFSLSASPTSLSVAQGGSGNSTISTAVSGGFNSAISLSASGLPSGVTASFNPGTIAAPGNGSSTLTFSASSTATTGTTNVTVTASGGGITHTVTISLTVTATATPDFTVSASPASVSVTQGSSGSSTISTTVSGGFNSAISLSTSALPSGVTASFNPTSIAAPGSGSSTLTFSASSTATTGTTNVTVNATGGGITHTATIALTVNTAGGTTTQILGNPGFENGKTNPAPWVLTSTHSPQEIIANSSLEPPHSGTFDAWLDGFGTTTTDTIMQQVTIPANATAATLSFWLHIDSAETSTTTAFDTLNVQIRDSSGNVLQTLATFSNLNKASGYQQHTFNLNSFIGQTIQIFLIGKEDFELQTSFVVDDFALQVTQ
jgi:uncharacterized membrane protein